MALVCFIVVHPHISELPIVYFVPVQQRKIYSWFALLVGSTENLVNGRRASSSAIPTARRADSGVCFMTVY